MHCPSCGQQQLSSETKFCSRCGLPLGLIAEVVSQGGYLPQLAELDKAQSSIWTRKNGLVFSLVWFIFWVPFMASIFGGVFDIEILGEIFALVGVMGSILIFILSLAYLTKKSKPATLAPPYLAAAPVEQAQHARKPRRL